MFFDSFMFFITLTRVISTLFIDEISKDNSKDIKCHLENQKN